MDVNSIENIFKNGDVVFIEFKNDSNHAPAIPATLAIYKEISGNVFVKYCSTMINFGTVSKNKLLCEIDSIKSIRLASNTEIKYFINKLQEDEYDFSNEIDLLNKKLNFTKNDLKSGMIVKTKNGRYYVVIGDLIVNCNGYMPLSKYNNELKVEHNDVSDISKEFDIIEIYYGDTNYEKCYLIQNAFNSSFCSCVSQLHTP